MMSVVIFSQDSVHNIYSIKIYTEASGFLFHVHRQLEHLQTMKFFDFYALQILLEELCVVKHWVNNCKYESLPLVNSKQLASLCIRYITINAQNFFSSVKRGIFSTWPIFAILEDIIFTDDKIVKMLQVSDQFF